MILVVLLDIPIARQVISFLYLLIIPGFVLLRAIRIKDLDLIETILFSIGLSLAFLMLLGFSLNLLSSIGLFADPLLMEPLITAIMIIVSTLIIVSYFVNKNDLQTGIGVPEDFNILPLLPYFALPLTSAIGVMLVVAFGINYMLLLVILVIAILFASISFSSRPSYYPLAIFSIALALVIPSFLISNYILGYDIHLEFFVFNVTKATSRWDPSLIWNLFNLTYIKSQYVYSTMLSVTVLPTVFSNIGNIEGVWLFKSLYPLLLSLVPVGLCQLLKR